MISYYELLGLIKEGKQPDKVEYDDAIYCWVNGSYEHSNRCEFLAEQLNEINMFNKNIKIIEEKPKQIEMINIPTIDNVENERICRAEFKINELTKAVNYLLKEDKQ